MTNTMIVYYSFSHTTQTLATEIARQTGGALRKLIPQKDYAFNYNTATKEVRSEIQRGYCPPLQSGNEPIQDYQTIFIGTPNWLKSLAPPVLTFLKSHDFTGKTLVPFCTHGGGGFGEIVNIIRRECPGAYLLTGIAINGNAQPEQITTWLKGIALIE